MDKERRRLAYLALGLIDDAVTDEQLAQGLASSELADQAMAYLLGAVVQMLANARREDLHETVVFIRRQLDGDDGAAGAADLGRPPRVGPPTSRLGPPST